MWITTGPVPVKSSLFGNKKKLLSFVRMTLTDTLPSACLLRVRFSICSVGFEDPAWNPKLQLRIYHKIHKPLKVSDWIPTKNNAYCAYCGMQFMLYNLNIYQCDPVCISFTGKRKLVWFCSKNQQESRCCFSAEIDKEGHILKSGSWLNCCNICITLTSYGWDMAPLCGSKRSACFGILWKHLFSYGISKDQPKLVVLRDMDTEPWKEAFWINIYLVIHIRIDCTTMEG